nr:hypothetical protein BaRGS_021758 [Batillaria attramentaria]
MPLGPFGEVVGTTGTLDTLSEEAQNYKSKVVAPRNPKLLRGDEPEYKMTPSKFLFDMKLDTEHKLANTHIMRVPRKVELLDMGDTSLQKFSQVNIDEPLFQPFPSEIYFQNFEPFEIYQVPLLLRNNDKVPRLVKVTQEDSPYFKIISPHNVGHKVGPGLPTTFYIQFMPDEKKDYNHELICHTEREKFVVPVQAIGARGILDFPDDVHFPTCPVKYPNSRTLLIRNIGNREARFTLEAEKPFTVTPTIGTLPVNDNLQVTIEFNPTQAGDHHGDLIITYDTGEKVFVSLYGAAQDASVRLDKNSLRMENTYLSMASQRTVTITNRSDVIAHFRWTQFATQEEEDQQKLLHQIELDREENTDTDRFLEECVADPTLRDKLSILSRTFQNRKRVVERDPMLFDDDVIKIEPVEGDIWPNSSFEVNIVFKPREAILYTRTAFCDITGRQSRLPLRIRGEGSGPKIEFSFEVLDMSNIFIGSRHRYELVMANKGDIDAIYSVLPNNSIFGPCFSFNPAEGIVMPGGHQAVQVAFSSPYLGDFSEDFSFQIDGSAEKLNVTFKGSVIGPTFQFDVPKLKFGMVSYGFKHTRTCTLMNTSLVPMSFHLRVIGDGHTPSICATTDLEPDAPENSPTPRHGIVGTAAREFDVLPSTGTIPPQSEMKVAVTLTSNQPRKYETVLVVDVDHVGEEILSLPITAKCIIPQITVLNPMMDYGRCFLRYPYIRSLRLHNDTDLPAKYIILPQEELGIDCPPILYQSSEPKGVVMPHSVRDVPLEIRLQLLEEQEMPCLVTIFGNQEPPMRVHISCIGEGPVVHMTPQKLDWGTVPVLTDMPQTITLSNESLISAKYTAHMLRPNSAFHVEPVEGEIPPESKMEIVVTANLDDCVKFQDKLQLNFLESQSRVMSLSACGVGTTITSDPPLLSVMDLGPNFSNRPLSKVFRLTNSGRRHQQLMWSTEGFAYVKPRASVHAKANGKEDGKHTSTIVQDPNRPIFILSPSRFELKPGESIDFALDAFVETPQVVRERLLCHAILGRTGGKELIMKVDVATEFISPLLEFSTKSLFYRVDKIGTEPLEVQTQSLELSNVSSLPLTVSLTLKYPFSIQLPSGDKVQALTVRLAYGEKHRLTVQFDPAYKKNLHIRTVDEVLNVTYEEHPHIDYIALRGEVYFPNLEFEKTSLDFGCILNDTEVTRYVNITNNSPMQVKYRWSFLVGNAPTQVRRNVRPRVREEAVLEEVVEVEEEEETGLVMEEVLPEEDQAISPEVEGDNRLVVVVEEEEEESDMKLEENDVEEEIMHIKDDDGPEHSADNRLFSQSMEAQPCPEEREALEKGQLEEIEGEKDHEKVMMERLLVGSRLSLREEEEEALRSNRILSALLEQEPEETQPLGIEEVFDILPLYGSLEPGDTEQVTFTFFGHADIFGEVMAICEVEGGPTYELMITGEASLVEYRFDVKDIDFGKQMYDHVATAELTLINTGKVAFEYHALNMDPTLEQRPGVIEPFAEQKLQVRFLPGVPERFHKSFSVQVAHFEADVINLYGEGVFPRVSLDLPRYIDDSGYYEALLEEARANLMPSTAAGASTSGAPLRAASSRTLLDPQHQDLVGAEQQTGSATNINIYASYPLIPVPPATGASDGMVIRRRKIKPRLPEYLLDFGYVVLGTHRTHVVRATNTGWCPVSFKMERGNIHNQGFIVELDRVRNLPGAPDNETVDFVVTFDPRAANLQLGPVEAVVPIHIVNGPQVALRLRAHVTMPDMEISDDVLDFQEVKCGECRVITVQIHNHQHVRCDWVSGHGEEETKQALRRIPMHLRKKKRAEKKKPLHFEILPPSGSLLPGQRINIQVKFMPSEEKFYEKRIPIKIGQSSQRILLLCRGQGLEPRLEFERQLVEFGPILPHSSGDEQEVIVRNPCSFPVEFYSLEFDAQYLDEEKVLRLMRGYDEYNTILLPPRPPGEKLPHELLDFYDEQMKKLEEEERAKEAEELRRQQEEELGEGAGTEDPEATKVAVDQGPVIQTIAPSPGLSPELLVPMTSEDAEKKEDMLEGKTATAVALARHYETAILTVDGVVLDAIANGNTSAGLRARQLCAEAARRKAEEMRLLEGEEEKKAGGLSVEAVAAHTQVL